MCVYETQVSHAKEPYKRDLYSAKRLLYVCVWQQRIDIGRKRFVGCFKTQVSNTKEPYKRNLYSAKETCICKHPTNRSHPIENRQFVGRMRVNIYNIYWTFKNTYFFAEYRSLQQGSFALETYICKHPTHRSHHIENRQFIGRMRVNIVYMYVFVCCRSLLSGTVKLPSPVCMCVCVCVCVFVCAFACVCTCACVCWSV